MLDSFSTILHTTRRLIYALFVLLFVTHSLSAFGPHGIRVSRPSGRKFTTSTTLSRGKNCCQFSDQTTCDYVIMFSLLYLLMAD